MTKVRNFLFFKLEKFKSILKIIFQTVKFSRLSCDSAATLVLSLSTRPGADRHGHVCGRHPVEPHWQCVSCGRLPESSHPGQGRQHRAVLHTVWRGKHTQECLPTESRLGCEQGNEQEVRLATLSLRDICAAVSDIKHVPKECF